LSSEDKARLEDAKKKLSAMISKEEDVDLEEASKGEYVVKLSGSKAFKKGEAEIKRFDRSGFKVVQGGVSGKLTRWPSAMPHEDSMIKIVKVHSPDDGEQVLIATLAEDLDEAKKVTYAQISKAAKRVTDNAVWDKEMKKLGLDPDKWNTGFDAFVLPIIVATVNGQGVEVDNTAMQSAKQMLKTILKSLSGGTSEGEETSESVIGKAGSSVEETIKHLRRAKGALFNGEAQSELAQVERYSDVLAARKFAKSINAELYRFKKLIDDYIFNNKDLSRDPPKV